MLIFFVPLSDLYGFFVLLYEFSQTEFCGYFVAMATGGAPPATSEASAAPATESSQPTATSETTEQSKPSEESMETTQVNNTNCLNLSYNPAINAGYSWTAATECGAILIHEHSMHEWF